MEYRQQPTLAGIFTTYAVLAVDYEYNGRAKDLGCTRGVREIGSVVEFGKPYCRFLVCTLEWSGSIQRRHLQEPWASGNVSPSPSR